MMTFVMAGLVPAIHVFRHGDQDVDARDKRGHDDSTESHPAEMATLQFVSILTIIASVPRMWRSGQRPSGADLTFATCPAVNS
jgi:hypothetical protein